MRSTRLDCYLACVEFADVIKARRAVRRYSERPVEQDKIAYILECARLAPSWANTQCWHFVVVRDAATVGRVAEATIALNRWLRNFPVMIVACGDTTKSGSHHGVDYWAVDVAIAMEHAVLAAADVGLGTCWMGVFDEDRVRSILGIPSHVKVLAISPLGYPGDDGRDPATSGIKMLTKKGRKSLEEIAHWDRW